MANEIPAAYNASDSAIGFAFDAGESGHLGRDFVVPTVVTAVDAATGSAPSAAALKRGDPERDFVGPIVVPAADAVAGSAEIRSADR